MPCKVKIFLGIKDYILIFTTKIYRKTIFICTFARSMGVICPFGMFDN